MHIWLKIRVTKAEHLGQVPSKQWKAHKIRNINKTMNLNYMLYTLVGAVLIEHIYYIIFYKLVGIIFPAPGEFWE